LALLEPDQPDVGLDRAPAVPSLCSARANPATAVTRLGR
jgi:hypothetical protein